MGVSLGGNSLVFGVAQGIPPIYIFIYIYRKVPARELCRRCQRLYFFLNFVTVLEQFLAWRAPEQNTDTSYLLQCFAVRILKVAGRECLTSY